MSADLKRISKEAEPTDSDRSGWEAVEQREDRRQTRVHRGRLVSLSSWLLGGWSIFLAVFMVLSGFQWDGSQLTFG